MSALSSALTCMVWVMMGRKEELAQYSWVFRDRAAFAAVMHMVRITSCGPSVYGSSCWVLRARQAAVWRSSRNDFCRMWSGMYIITVTMFTSLQQAEDDQGGAERQQLRLLRAEPALPCTADHLHINRAGTYALVYGHMASAEVTPPPPLVATDLMHMPAGLHPAVKTTFAEVVMLRRGAQTQEDGLPALHVISLTQRDDDAAAVPLDDAQLVDRPGLQILQASWHPASDMHFAVLGSDNVFRLYHIDDLSAPVSCATDRILPSKHPASTLQQSIIMWAACVRMQEQQVELRLRERQPLGLTDMEGSQAAAFAFGSLHMWCVSILCQAESSSIKGTARDTATWVLPACRERFSVVFACADGRTFVLVPFVPFGECAPH